MVFDKLNSNYVNWAQLVKVTIKGRVKLGYLDGTKKKPEKDEKALTKWEQQNYQVMTWLIQTMQPNIGKNYLFIKDVNELWKAMKEAFFARGNDELENQILEFHQGEADVNTSYSTLKGL